MEKDSGKRFVFDPKYRHFSWALAESQEQRDSRLSPDQILAPFITQDAIRRSISELLEDKKGS